MKIRYKGNLSKYSISYKGTNFVFCAQNDYQLDFDDTFAKGLIKSNPNLYEEVVIKKEKTEIKEDDKVKSSKGGIK